MHDDSSLDKELPCTWNLHFGPTSPSIRRTTCQEVPGDQLIDSPGLISDLVSLTAAYWMDRRVRMVIIRTSSWWCETPSQQGLSECSPHRGWGLHLNQATNINCRLKTLFADVCQQAWLNHIKSSKTMPHLSWKGYSRWFSTYCRPNLL